MKGKIFSVKMQLSAKILWAHYGFLYIIPVSDNLGEIKL